MSEHVLVVEDNLALAENIAELLSDAGFQVAIRGATDEALACAREQGFDLALVDVGLAGRESGLDLVPRLRLHSHHGEIVLMTGNATLHSALQAIRSGVYAYLPKPFDPEELIAISRRALAQVALKREKQALAQRLAASESLYRGVVETVETCILGLDVDGHVRFGNRFAGDCLGVPTGALEGRALIELIERRAERELKRAIGRAVAGETVRDLELRHKAHGKTRYVRWTLTPLYATPFELAQRAEIPPPSVLAVGLDITERLELERRSAEAQAMAAMGSLTTSLAHEIRNPLNAAKLQLELLTRRAKRDGSIALQHQIEEPAKLVRTEIERLSLLLDDFLNLARPRLPVRLSCKVAELLEDVVTLEQPLAAQAGVNLSFSVSEPGLTARIDKDKLKQVLLNLVRNSIEALSERGAGHVRLRAKKRPEGGVIMSVRDDGPGLPAELVQDAFQAFVTTKPAGTGLGLAIVRKIIAQHEGEVTLAPDPDGGTVVHFWVSD